MGFRCKQSERGQSSRPLLTLVLRYTLSEQAIGCKCRLFQGLLRKQRLIENPLSRSSEWVLGCSTFEWVPECRLFVLVLVSSLCMLEFVTCN